MIKPSIMHIDTGRSFRGGQRQVFLLTRELNKLGLNQIIACPQSGPLPNKVADIPIAPLSDYSLLRKINAGKLKNVVEKYKINIIHAHDSEGHSLGAILKRKIPHLKLLVTRRVTFLPSSRVSIKYKYLRTVDKYIAISKAVAKSLNSIGIPGDRIDIIYSGLDLGALRADVKESASYSEISNKYQYIIVTAGALTKEKDFATAMSAFSQVSKKISGTAWLIFGEGPMRSKLTRKISEMKLTNAFLMGYQEPLAPIFGVADLFLLTSQSEGLNSAAMEAAACGLPLVVSNIGGLPEVVEKEYNGLLCRPGDAGEFAACIVKLLLDDKLRQQMSENAMLKAKQFDISYNVQSVVDIYNRLLVS